MFFFSGSSCYIANKCKRDKKTYFKSDIKAIKETIDKLESKFPVKVEFYQTLDNLTRKDIEVWKCECGKENSLEREICRGCNRDIHGLKNSNINLKEIKENLIAQLTAPVRWTQCVQAMIADGGTDFIEVGPGKVLQGLVKKINRESEVSSATIF